MSLLISRIRTLLIIRRCGHPNHSLPFLQFLQILPIEETTTVVEEDIIDEEKEISIRGDPDASN